MVSAHWETLGDALHAQLRFVLTEVRKFVTLVSRRTRLNMISTFGLLGSPTTERVASHLQVLIFLDLEQFLPYSQRSTLTLGSHGGMPAARPGRHCTGALTLFTMMVWVRLTDNTTP